MSDAERFPAFDAERSAAIRRLVLEQIPAPSTAKQRRRREGRPALIGILAILALFVVGGGYLAVHGVQSYSAGVGDEQDAVGTSSATPSGAGGGASSGVSDGASSGASDGASGGASTDSGAGSNEGGPFGGATSGTNARGQTWGPAPTTSSSGSGSSGSSATTALPDLVLEHGITAEGGLVAGYVPASVYTNAPVDSVVPLYANDGTTKVGTWVVKRSGSPSR